MAKLAVDCWRKNIDMPREKCYKLFIEEVINMLDEINVLREKLDRQVQENASYDDVLKTSRQIDKLLVEYYKSAHSFDVIA